MHTYLVTWVMIFLKIDTSYMHTSCVAAHTLEDGHLWSNSTAWLYTKKWSDLNKSSFVTLLD